jgi:hypothetical protein
MFFIEVLGLAFNEKVSSKLIQRWILHGNFQSILLFPRDTEALIFKFVYLLLDFLFFLKEHGVSALG